LAKLHIHVGYRRKHWPGYIFMLVIEGNIGQVTSTGT